VISYKIYVVRQQSAQALWRCLILLSLLSILGMHIQLCKCGVVCVASKVSTVTLISTGCHMLYHGNKRLYVWQTARSNSRPISAMSRISDLVSARISSQHIKAESSGASRMTVHLYHLRDWTSQAVNVAIQQHNLIYKLHNADRLEEVIASFIEDPICICGIVLS